MGGAPTTIEWLRPGVGYVPAAAASMRRLEAAIGRPHDCNSSYRDYGKQMSMYNAWNLYASGRGPHPGHSRAIHPDASMHCRGLADDSDDWTTPGYIGLAADHGWIRTAANDPTERHHFEYQSWRDKHRNDPAPMSATLTGGFLMALSDAQQAQVYDALVKHSPSGDYYTPDAVINILREEIAIQIARVAAGGIFFPGTNWNAFETLANVSREDKGKPVKVDEKAIAAALAPLLPANVSAINSSDLARIAKAVADEQAKRLAS